MSCLTGWGTLHQLLQGKQSYQLHFPQAFAPSSNLCRFMCFCQESRNSRERSPKSLVLQRKCCRREERVWARLQRGLRWHDVGSSAGWGRGFGARAAGFQGRFAAGRWSGMCWEAAAEAGFKCRGERGVKGSLRAKLLSPQVIQSVFIQLYFKAARSQWSHWKILDCTLYLCWVFSYRDVSICSCSSCSDHPTVGLPVASTDHPVHHDCFHKTPCVMSVVLTDRFDMN